MSKLPRNRSMRWRLLVWQAALLVLVVMGLGAVVLVQARATMFAEMDAGLLSGARVLESVLMKAAGPPENGSPFYPGSGRPGFGPPESGSFRPGRADRRPGREPPDDDGQGRPIPPRQFVERLDSLPAEMFRLPGSMMGRRGLDREPPWFAIFDSEGTLRRRSETGPAILPPRSPRRSHDFRMNATAREVVLRGPGQTLIVVGQDATRPLADFYRMATATALGAATVLAGGMLGGWWLTGRAVAPIDRITRTAESVSAATLTARIDAGELDVELAGLAGTLNSMLARLQESFDRQVRFAADASHELRTPIAVLIMHSELALSRPRPAEDYQATLQTCLRAAERMKLLVDDLLLLSRADVGQLNLNRRGTDLAGLVDEAAGFLHPLADEKNVRIRVETAAARADVDPEKMLQVVLNLLRNAIQYNRPDGEVVMRTSAEAGVAVIEVDDTGEGIETRHLPHLFERFYRIDPARSRDRGGSGLGLAICQSIVMAHGGRITVESVRGEGSRFRVTLPAEKRDAPGTGTIDR